MAKFKTDKQFKLDVVRINQDIIPIGTYEKSNIAMLFYCKICGNEWKALPNNILHGRGCPECAIKSGKYNGNGTRQYNTALHNASPPRQPSIPYPDRFLDRIKDRPLSVIGTCVDSKTAILFECDICSHQWNATPNNISAGRGCPKCRISKGEELVEQWLNQQNINFNAQQTFEELKDKYRLRLDFYLPELNTVIEVDGKQHREINEFFGGEEQFKDTQRKDQLKNQFCENQGIRLIRMEYDCNRISEFENEFDKLEVLL